MDLAGERGRHPNIQILYYMNTKSPELVLMPPLNGECPHWTIGNVLCLLLTGDNLENNFWTFSFHHSFSIAFCHMVREVSHIPELQINLLTQKT